MKIYFAYDEKTGEFNGFYNDEIHKQIPKASVEITEGLQNDLLTGIWFLDLSKLKDISNPLDINDKDIFFKEKSVDEPSLPNENTIILKQLANLKLDLLKRDALISSLTNQVALIKIENMKLKGGR